jgi:hypothetical protein
VNIVEKFHDVTHMTPDGTYVLFRGEVAQIIVVGPTLFSPRGIVDEIGREWRITRTDMLPAMGPGSDEFRQTVLDRGFLAIWIQREGER